ncbi:hypothetical protein WOLCODRAFT_161150 [Wolfiporia cocos MD-104 SS10]|uniref:EH domain-containing protein n=1 Tax=Wolfiporia cocos (strain MD-104) TaxID=742152 RepID=A0A2H3JMP4_WOLCO|nr:hypothetical protein WOLCODRAFT_161150 [Wolfiporia cocos MD-104 SS10]
MAPSTLQARINAFESLNNTRNAPHVSRSPPSLLDSPISPAVTANFRPIAPRPAAHSPSPSPPNLGRKTSLIDLQDWVVDDGPTPSTRQKPFVSPKPRTQTIPITSPRHAADPVLPNAPLINFEPSPPDATSRPAPPLPPRKPSYSSLKSVSTTTTASTSSSVPRSPVGPPAPLPPRKPPPRDKLTVDHTYPPPGTLGLTTSPRHVPVSSISSFHSVSLDDGVNEPPSPALPPRLNTTLTERDFDTASLAESFENVSVASGISPAVSLPPHDWDVFRPRSEPPKLPQRPQKANSLLQPAGVPSTSKVTSPRATGVRKLPPQAVPYRARIPPSRTSSTSTNGSTASRAPSERASNRNTIASYAHMQTTKPSPTPAPVPTPKATRPTPVPPAARSRYEELFDRNVLHQSQAESRLSAKSPPPEVARARKAAGWRGLSVDLLTNPDLAADSGSIPGGDFGADARLSGEIVARIWRCSRLERSKLKTIWSECDPRGVGTLDREAFVKGMWRIDEELRRDQVQKQRLSSVLGRHGSRGYVRTGMVPTQTKIILR